MNMTEKERLIERTLYLREQIENMYYNYTNSLEVNQEQMNRIDIWFENVMQKMTFLIEEFESVE